MTFHDTSPHHSKLSLLALVVLLLMGGCGTPPALLKEGWSEIALVRGDGLGVQAVSCPTSSYCMLLDANDDFFRVRLSWRDIKRQWE
jgi:hypothetical protein